MKDSKGYLERMRGAMREKLFFIEHLDLSNKIIIDFGAADGTLIKELINIGYENTTYFCVENYAEFLQTCKQLKEIGDVIAASGLTEVEMWLRGHKQYGNDTREVVLICSSVLHECTWSMQRVITSFALNWCNYFILRDMFWDNFVHRIDWDARARILGNIITYAPHPDLMQEFFKLRGVSDESIKEYLLKYTYVDNWETEVEECYLNVDWTAIKDAKGVNNSAFEVVYENIYTNQFIKERIFNDFGFNISWPTHCQLILKVNQGG